MTKAEIKSALKAKLASDGSWACRAIVRVYEHQTSAEQSTGETIEHNGVGFSGRDANILSSFAEQLKQGRTLSPKQLAVVFRCAPRYWGQVLPLIPADKVSALVDGYRANAVKVA